MKIRIKFSKQGAMKFIGHLDILRYFQKAMRRADVDIKYSEGFSPHQVMSFAAPLGVGLTSNGEYMDIEVLSTKPSKEMVDQLNHVMVEGMRVLSCRRLADTAKNAMSCVAAADYTISFAENGRPNDMEAFKRELVSFYQKDIIEIVKTTKKSEKILDIKPLIYEMSMNGETIFLKVASGSANNLKPELVMEAFCRYLGQECTEFIFQIQREEVYADDGDEINHCFRALEAYGEEIE